MINAKVYNISYKPLQFVIQAFQLQAFQDFNSNGFTSRLNSVDLIHKHTYIIYSNLIVCKNIFFWKVTIKFQTSELYA